MSEQQISPLEQRIDMLISDLKGKRRSTYFSANVTLLIGLLVIILLCVYFGIGYYILDDVTKPDKVVQSAKAMVDDYAKEARTVAAEEIQKSAPIWAQEVSNEFITSMPDLRERAEAGIEQVLDEQLLEGRRLTTEQFAKLLQENRKEFSEAIATLTDEENTQAFVDTVMPIVEEEYVPALRYDAIQILGVLEDLDRRIERLATAEDLNPIEEQQRHILGLARLLREKRAPETFDEGELEQARN